jgi:multiple sugar transport system ATP-binding protein
VDLPHGAANLVTRLSAESRLREGADARVWLNLDKIHLFDPADGRNITLHEGRAAGVVAS